MREFRPERVPLPQTQLTYADLPQPLDLEIGAGQGLHAIQYCTAHPDRFLLAIERTSEKFARLQSRHVSHPNVRGLIPLHADAISVVTHIFPPDSLERVFMLYPNPYPKPKQANLRFHNSPFMGELKRKMKSGAQLRMATNLEWYADEACKRMTEDWGFQLHSRQELEPDFPARTHFEKKYLNRGETCFDLIFLR